MKNRKKLALLTAVFIFVSLTSCSMQYPADAHYEKQENGVRKSSMSVKRPSPEPAIQEQPKTTVIEQENTILDPNMSVDQLNRNLFMAAKVGKSQLMIQLVQQGADVNASNENGETALHAAATNGHVGVINLLYGYNADTNARTVEGWTALHSAARFGHAGAVKALIEGGAIVGYLTKDGKTALSFARQLGHEDVVQVLMAKGATR